MDAACDRVFNFMGLESIESGSPADERGDVSHESIDPRVDVVAQNTIGPMTNC